MNALLKRIKLFIGRRKYGPGYVVDYKPTPMPYQPEQYYVESCRGMYHIWLHNIANKGISQDGLNYFIPKILKSRKKGGFWKDAYEDIDEFLQAAYNYSKEMGFIDQNMSNEAFIAIYDKDRTKC